MNNKTSHFKNKKVIRSLGLIIIITTLAVSYFIYKQYDGKVYIDNSKIQAPVINISPSTSGRVLEMDVKEGDMVQTGDKLAVVGSETLRAYTEGLILSASDLTGSNVSPQTQLIQMIRPSKMRVSGTIDEDKGLNEIKPGQVVSFTIDALPGKTFWGYIDEVSPGANTPVFSFSTSTERQTQQFIVYANFDSSRYKEIKTGMSAKMIVYTKTR